MSHAVHGFLGKRLFLASASALLALVCLAGSPRPATAADKAKGQEISRSIAKEINAAQKALQAGQWTDAIKNLDAAEAKPPLTAYDKRMIEEDKGFAYSRLNNAKAAETAYEAAIATGSYTPEEVAQKQKILFRLAAASQNYPKALEYGKAMSDAGAATTDDLGIIAQIYYLQKDCKSSAIWSDKAVASAKKSGEAPKEMLYQFKLQCASDSGDNASMVQPLTDLIRLTNKTVYWNTLLRIARGDERDDHNLLMIYRLMYDTNAMTQDTDYIEMAQLLNDAALPGEATMVLDKAMTAPGIMKDEHKERTARLMASLKTKADNDKKGLPGFDAEGAKNAAGQLDVKTGEVYYGAGDYPSAVTTINRGLGKGQVKSLDEAYVYLGRAQVNLKNAAEAKKAFAKLKDVPNISPRVLKLYDLYSEKVGSPQG